MSYKYSSISLLIITIFSACEKKELPVASHNPGTVIMATVNLGTPYKYQIYFNLKTNSVVGQNLKTIWDIGCETRPHVYHIVLNTSKSMFAYNTGKTDFNSVNGLDTAGFSNYKKWDTPSGNLDSTAIGDWRTLTPVYIVDCGYDENGKWLGMEKLQVLNVTDSNYKLRFCALNGSHDTTIDVVKDSLYNLSFMSFTTQQQVTVEPPKNTWDIAFTQYTYVFYDYNPPLPYLVTGCLLNRNNTRAVKDTLTDFDSIAYGDVNKYQFSDDISIIGYDWKTYTGNGYAINLLYNYIINTADGRYYKFHFTGYYNSNGQEGNPQWEYQEL